MTQFCVDCKHHHKVSDEVGGKVYDYDCCKLPQALEISADYLVKGDLGTVFCEDVRGNIDLCDVVGMAWERKEVVVSDEEEPEWETSRQTRRIDDRGKR